MHRWPTWFGEREWPGGRAWLRWLPAILWAALIFHATASPSYTGEQTEVAVAGVLPSAAPTTVHLLNILVRKASHVLAFGLLAVLAYRALPATAARGLNAWVLTALYATSDELHQYFVPGRSAEVRDVLIDATAAFLFLSLAALASSREWGRRRA